MKNTTKIIIVFLLVNQYSDFLLAQYTFFRPKENFAIEVSLPNSDLKRLPIYRNSISSLIVSGDHIIAGTSADKGLAPFIFVASMEKHQMVEIMDIDNIIPGQQAVKTGFCKGDNNTLYAGTMANKKKDGSNGDGHLLELIIDFEGKINIKDLGIVFEGEGIYSLISGDDKNTLYGVSYPSGLFFKYTIDTKEIKTYNDIVATDKQVATYHDYNLEPKNYLCKSIIEVGGLIYGSMPINKIFYFDPQNESFNIVSDIPEIWGRRTLGQVESWAVSESGKIYGGNAGDGQLFEIDPGTGNLKNLGKPIGMNRLRGLIFGNDGKLYGIAGGRPGYAHLFSYDEQNGFIDLGNPEFTMVAPGIEQGILWRGFQIGTITSSEDGKYIVMGEDESLSQLLIFALKENPQGRVP
jgi:hypothetical protein